MDLLSQTKYLIKKTGLRPDKLKGQNFCINEEVIKEMVRVAQVSKQDTVLEVGAGFGFLTVELLKSAKKVLAVELDRKLIAVLKNLGSVQQNLEIIQDDILKLKTETLRLRSGQGLRDYKIVSNLPYSITSAFLKKFLTAENKPQAMTLLIQKEVAERICATPGKMSLLSLSIQLYSSPKIVKNIEKSNFWPKPQVDSAIIQIDNLQDFPYQEVIAEKKFWQIVRSGFCSKRKQLKNNLASSLHLPTEVIIKIFKQIGLNPTTRAQELAIKDWFKLSQELKNWLY